MKDKTYTAGDIIVEDIKVGDIHHEFQYSFGIKCEVITKPKLTDTLWEWKSKNIKTGLIINYAVDKEHAHYGPKLYSYEAYDGIEYI